MAHGHKRLRIQRVVTLEGVAEQYLADLALRAKPTTIKAARSAMAVLQRELPGFPTRDNLEAWRRARVAQGRSNRTVNRDLTTLGAALAYALDRGWIRENPVRAIRRLPQKGRHRRRIARALPDDEIRRLLDAAASIDARKPRLFPRAPLLRALFETGCRWGELVAATWGDLDTDASVIHLRGETTKTDRDRTVYLAPGTLKLLLGLRADHVRVTGELPTAGSRLFLRPRGTPWGRDTSGFHAFLSEAMRLAHLPKADAAGRVLPPARRPKVVHHPLRPERRARPPRGQARRNPDHPSRGRSLPRSWRG